MSEEGITREEKKSETNVNIRKSKFYTFYNTDESWVHCTKWNVSVTKDKSFMIPLRCGKQIHKGRKQSAVCQGLGGGESGKPLFKSASVNIARWESSQELDMRVAQCEFTAYLQMINMLNYAMCVIPQLNMLTQWLVQDFSPKALEAEAGRSPQAQARIVYSEIWVIESCTAHPVSVIN